MIWIAIFGMAGVLCRYSLDILIPSVTFPLSTFLINILGAFLAGALFASSLPSTLKSPLLVGFLGGFTTFSSYSLQTLALIEKNQIKEAIFYWLGSPVLGLTAAWVGAFLGRLILLRG